MAMVAALVLGCTPAPRAVPRGYSSEGATARTAPPLAHLQLPPLDTSPAPTMSQGPSPALSTTTTVAAPSIVHADSAPPVPTTSAPVEQAPTSNAAIWACIEQAESGGNPAENTGNGYYGALQFAPATWDAAVLAAGLPQYANGRADLAPLDVQQAVATFWQSVAGWGQWGTAAGCGA